MRRCDSCECIIMPIKLLELPTQLCNLAASGKATSGSAHSRLRWLMSTCTSRNSDNGSQSTGRVEPQFTATTAIRRASHTRATDNGSPVTLRNRMLTNANCLGKHSRLLCKHSSLATRTHTTHREHNVGPERATRRKAARRCIASAPIALPTILRTAHNCRQPTDEMCHTKSSHVRCKLDLSQRISVCRHKQR